MVCIITSFSTLTYTAAVSLSSIIWQTPGSLALIQPQTFIEKRPLWLVLWVYLSSNRIPESLYTRIRPLLHDWNVFSSENITVSHKLFWLRNSCANSSLPVYFFLLKFFYSQHNDFSFRNVEPCLWQYLQILECLFLLLPLLRFRMDAPLNS